MYDSLTHRQSELEMVVNTCAAFATKNKKRIFKVVPSSTRSAKGVTTSAPREAGRTRTTTSQSFQSPRPAVQMFTLRRFRQSRALPLVQIHLDTVLSLVEIMVLQHLLSYTLKTQLKAPKGPFFLRDSPTTLIPPHYRLFLCLCLPLYHGVFTSNSNLDCTTLI